MILKKCENNHYTLKDTCPKCKSKTKDAHYKFLKLPTSKEKQTQ